MTVPDPANRLPNDLGDAWIEHAFRELERAGYRAGGARSQVVELLGRAGGCLTAEDALDALRAAHRRVGTASVYRALAVLTELLLLHRAAAGEGPARYELVHPSNHHHHHLVCDRCGRTITFEDSRLEEAIEAASGRAGYAVEAHDLTLHGACPECVAGVLTPGRRMSSLQQARRALLDQVSRACALSSRLS